jgi:hypothetical protein
MTLGLGMDYGQYEFKIHISKYFKINSWLVSCKKNQKVSFLSKVIISKYDAYFIRKICFNLEK